MLAINDAIPKLMVASWSPVQMRSVILCNKRICMYPACSKFDSL